MRTEGVTLDPVSVRGAPGPVGPTEFPWNTPESMQLPIWLTVLYTFIDADNAEE